MKEEISSLYSNFFNDLNVDNDTGVIKGTNLKFATYPYIGENYSISKKKILFVGLDIGRDETPGKIQDFDKRRKSIAAEMGFNPHIAGTYATALYFLRNDYGWENVWEKFKIHNTSQQGTKMKNHQDGQNPLYFVALTNYFKFVTDKRINRTGDLNRKYSNEVAEKNLFISEVKILNPDIIIFQGNLPIHDVLIELKIICPNIYKARHPSNRLKGGRQPELYTANIAKL